MPRTNILFGGGAAVAGLGGLAAAALTAGGAPDPAPAATTAAQAVETQTVVVRKVEHRVRRAAKARHPRVRRITPATVPASTTRPTAPVATPAPAHTTPLRTRASGGGSLGEDDSGEREREHENEVEHEDESGEHQDD